MSQSTELLKNDFFILRDHRSSRPVLKPKMEAGLLI